MFPKLREKFKNRLLLRKDMKYLGTKTAIKILKILFENPLQEFKEIELVREAKVGKGSASTTINNLVKEGILVEKRIGKAKLLSLKVHSTKTYLIKTLLDQEKLSRMQVSKLASVLYFKNEVGAKTELVVLFGSTIAGTSTEDSDVDLLIVGKDFKEERKKVEELFGERFNIHSYTKGDLEDKRMSDNFIQNAILNGVVLKGYDLGKVLFSGLREKEERDRLIFFRDRIKSSLRNYLQKDYKTSQEIVERTVEQIVPYILSKKSINYSSKKDSEKQMEKIPEGRIIKKIKSSQLKEKINILEDFIKDMICDVVLKNEGYK
jgi:predicted nucleotidyltransferase